MAPPFFSVCIPVYNGSRYLEQCIDSVLDQTFSDFEIILIDDGSSDISLEIMKRYESSESRIKVYKNTQNLGLVGNWNACLNKSSGKWIKFLFQDDFLDSNCLYRIFEKRNEADFIFSRRNFMIEKGADAVLTDFYKSEAANDYPLLRGRTKLTAEQVCDLILSNPGFNFFGEPSNIAFNSSCKAKFGAFDSSLIQLCDYEYSARLASNTGAYFISDKLSTFRVHSEATSSSNLTNKTFHYKYIDLLIIYFKYLNNSSYCKLREYSSLFNGRNYINKLNRKQQLRISKQLHYLTPSARKTIFLIIKNFVPDAYCDIKTKYAFRFFIIAYNIVKNKLHG